MIDTSSTDPARLAVWDGLPLAPAPRAVIQAALAGDLAAIGETPPLA